MIYLHFRILLKNGAEVDAKDIKDYTPLFYAAKANGIEASYYLLEGRADPNARAINGKTPLFKACTYKDVMLLNNYEVKKYAKMHAEEDETEGLSALEYLTKNNYEESPLALLGKCRYLLLLQYLIILGRQ